MTIDERVDMLKEAGIDLQVLCVGGQQPAFEKAEEAASVASYLNDMYAETCKGYGGRFSAFGATPLPHVEPAIQEAGRCLDDLGMLGINIGTSIAGRPPDDSAFEPFFADLDRRGAVLFLHPVGVGGPNMDAYGLDFMMGACFEDTVASVRLVMSGLSTKYPNIRIIVPHLGGTLPFLFQRIDSAIERQRLGGANPPVDKLSEAVRGFYWDTVNNYPGALRLACEALGADHIMLGTDFPFLLFKPCVEYVQKSGLPAEQIDQILERTAGELLGVK